MLVIHKTLIAVLLTLAFALAPALASAVDREAVIRLATTTSTDNSGLLDDLLPRFKAATGYGVHVIAVGTGKALRMGRDGDVDAVLVHAPDAERTFVAQGYGEQRLPVMYNDFLIVGPSDDPAGIAGAHNAGDALLRIAVAKAPFISRGDDSGTHKKEKALWETAANSPSGPWYREAGQGMGKVLQIADELGAYTLIDRGTWLAYRDSSRLQAHFQGGEDLFNPYAIIRVSESRHPSLNHVGAEALIAWIRSDAGQQAIGAFRRSGQQLFMPSANRIARR